MLILLIIALRKKKNKSNGIEKEIRDIKSRLSNAIQEKILHSEAINEKFYTKSQTISNESCKLDRNELGTIINGKRFKVFGEPIKHWKSRDLIYT